jgi:Cdc6-like AAA superfamily ATPase
MKSFLIVSIVSILKHPQTVVFKPYNHEQLKKILTLRVGEYIFDNSALELMTRRIAATSGDARGILEMAIKAIDHCHETFSETDRKAVVVQSDDLSNKETSSNTISYPLVKVNHVMKVVRDSNPRLTETILGQPRAAQIVLCVALTLSRHMSADTVITLSSLLEYTRAASRFGLMEMVSSSDFSDIVKNLSDAGLLLIGEESACFSYDASRTPIQIGVQLEDVESAMGETLLTQPFYAKIVEKLNESLK